jgi:predicted TIM-barrel fold metal-dependent hydrolase
LLFPDIQTATPAGKYFPVPFTQSCLGASMRQRCISGDSHIDMGWLPPQLFVANASSQFRDRMPYVEDTPKGPRWTTRGGLHLGFACGLGASGRPYEPGKHDRADKMAAEGLFADGMQGVRRISEPDLRVKDQLRDGVDGEILYGILGMSDRLKDEEASVEMLRIYNDWLRSFCSYSPDRLLGLANIPCHTPEMALEEARRIVNIGGLRGLDMAAASPAAKPYYHRDWDPFWSFASEVGMPVHFHTFGPEFPAQWDTWDPMTKEGARASAFACGQFFRAARVLTGLVMGGVLDRFPKVKIVFAESGIGWIPYILDRMNWAWDEEFRHSLKLSLRPSEYWHRQCFASFQTEESALSALELIGLDNILWASDFPHPDGIWPDSQAYISKLFGHMSTDDRDKIAFRNAAGLYGLPV